MPSLNNFMMPFHVILLQEILVKQNDACLGLFTVREFMKLSQTCKSAYKLIVKYKIIKKLVRFGNLDSRIRVKFWRKLSPFYQI